MSVNKTISLKDKLKALSQNGFKKIVLIAIIAVVSLSMIPWAINSYNLRDDGAWVKVGSKEVYDSIILADYNSFIQKNYMYLQQNPFMLVSFLNNLLGQHVSTLLFANEAESINLSISDQTLLQLIANIPSFKNPDGTFNKAEFQKRITESFGSEEIFLNNIKNSMLKDELLEPVFSLLKEPNYLAYIEFLSIMQERTISYIEITKSMIKTKIDAPKDADLVKIRDDNKDRFSKPELRSGESVIISLADLSKNIAVSNEEVKTYYEDNKSNYMEEIKLDVYQANFSTEKDATAFYDKIKNLAPAEIMKEDRLNSLGQIQYNDLPEDLAKPVFEMKASKPAKPVKSTIGWHVFFVKEKIEPKPMPLTKVKNEINQELLYKKKAETVEKVKQLFNDLLANKTHLKDIVKKIKDSYQILEPQYKEFNAVVEDADELNKVIFQTPANGYSQAIENKDGDLFAVFVSKIDAPRTLEVNEVKADLLKIWNENKTQEQLNIIAANILSDIATGKKLDKLGYKIQTTKLIRTEQNKTFTEESSNNLFSLAKNKAIQGTLINKNIFIGLISDIKNSKEEYLDKKNNRSKELVGFTDYINQSYVQGLLERYASNLESKYKVKINEKAIIDRLSPQQPTEGQ